MYKLPDALAALIPYKQFLLWRASTDPQTGKIIKRPVDYRTMRVGSAVDPQCWTDVHTASALSEASEDLHVGFSFTKDDPFFFFDIDGAYDGVQWSQQATEFCAQFAGAAIEVSVSGNGLHIFGTGQCPLHACKNVPLGLELYTQDRFAAFGRPETMTGSAALDCTQALQTLVPSYFDPSNNTVHADTAEWTTVPRSDWKGHTDDEALITAMCRVTTTPWGEVTGSKASARDLWTANEQALSLSYPDDKRPYDASSADAALMSHLAYWTGCDCERMLRLMQQSALVREKWTKHRSYLRLSILSAAQFQKKVHHIEDVIVKPVDTITEGIRNGYQYMPVNNQIAHFKHCTYVAGTGRVLIENGSLLKPEVFRATFGGYDFQMATANDKTIDDPYKVLTQSQAYTFRKADDICFDPQHEFNTLIERDGLTLVNEYKDPQVTSCQGDVQPFLTHLSKVLPVERDRDILLAYMAAIVQHKGVKFQWAPLLQGTEGNGKTLFTRCITEAIGQKYTHMVDASDLFNKFNAWMYGNIFIGVEDIKVAESQMNVMEKLKPMITSEYISVQAKGVDQSTKHVCCNFLFNSNHKTAIRKSKNDRRFCIFYTAQQKVEDLQRDGMSGDYFPELYKWLRADGYAAVTHYLRTYAIPDALNPAVDCDRAPRSSTIDSVLNESLGSMEQEILEAIDSGRQGFCGGWISSIALDTLLAEKRVRMSRNKRLEMLEAMGYVKHSALPGGRTTRLTSIDRGRTVLFVDARNTLLTGLTNGGEVTTAYVQAQNTQGGVLHNETIRHKT